MMWRIHITRPTNKPAAETLAPPQPQSTLHLKAGANKKSLCAKSPMAAIKGRISMALTLL